MNFEIEPEERYIPSAVDTTDMTVTPKTRIISKRWKKRPDFAIEKIEQQKDKAKELDRMKMLKENLPQVERTIKFRDAQAKRLEKLNQDYENKFGSSMFDDFNLVKHIDNKFLIIENDRIYISKDKIFQSNVVFEEFVEV